MNISPNDPGDEMEPQTPEEPAKSQNPEDEKKIRVYVAPSEDSKKDGHSASDEASILMSEMSGPKIYKLGDRVKGKIVQVKDDSLIVNIGTKNEGIVPREELSFVPAPTTEGYQVGEEMDMIVIKQADDDTYYLSKKRAEEDKMWDAVEEAAKAGKRLKAIGSQVVNAGLILDMGIRGFLPQSHADIKRIEVADLVGQEFEVKVLEFDRNSRPQRLVVSRRLVLEEDLTRERDEVYDKFKIGDVVKGKVEKLTNFGAFVNLGGVTGLLHISQMSRKRISDPSEAVKVGEEFDVKIIDIDREKKKIRLSRRELLPDLWDEVDKTYHPNQIIEGTVVRVTSFGAFIKIDNYFEGLAHISELVDNKINHAKEVLSPGDKVTVMILEIDKVRRRIRLSVKRAVEREARREVDAYLKQQEDIRNTLRIPADGFMLPESALDEEKVEEPVKVEAEAPAPEVIAEEPPAVEEEPVVEAAPEPEPVIALEPEPAPAETEPAIEPVVELAVEEPAAGELPEQGASSEDMDLISGDELEDATLGRELPPRTNVRGTNDDIDLVEGSELDEK